MVTDRTVVNLSKSFTLEQLTFSETAVRKGLDNTPNDEQIANLTELAQSLERVQDFLGHPIISHSAFRSHKVNSAVGGSPTSAHLEGFADDFVCPGFGTPLEVCKALAGSGIPFDQIIYEYESWCHWSIAPAMRGMLLSKHSGEPYTTGLA